MNRRQTVRLGAMGFLACALALLMEPAACAADDRPHLPPEAIDAIKVEMDRKQKEGFWDSVFGRFVLIPCVLGVGILGAFPGFLGGVLLVRGVRKLENRTTSLSPDEKPVTIDYWELTRSDQRLKLNLSRVWVLGPAVGGLIGTLSWSAILYFIYGSEFWQRAASPSWRDMFWLMPLAISSLLLMAGTLWFVLVKAGIVRWTYVFDRSTDQFFRGRRYLSSLETLTIAFETQVAQVSNPHTYGLTSNTYTSYNVLIGSEKFQFVNQAAAKQFGRAIADFLKAPLGSI